MIDAYEIVARITLSEDIIGITAQWADQVSSVQASLDKVSSAMRGITASTRSATTGAGNLPSAYGRAADAAERIQRAVGGGIAPAPFSPPQEALVAEVAICRRIIPPGYLAPMIPGCLELACQCLRIGRQGNTILFRFQAERPEIASRAASPAMTSTAPCSRAASRPAVSPLSPPALAATSRRSRSPARS